MTSSTRWKKAHPAEVAAQHRRWTAAHPEYREYMAIYLDRRRYGLTLQGRAALMLQQNGACAVCGETFAGRGHVDHNHMTGKVRGLLCNNCNRGIGLLRDRSEILMTAAQYLAASEGE